MVDGAMDGDITAQPEDVPVAAFDLGLLVVVRFEVSMRQRLRVLRIRFVDMLWRDAYGAHQPVRQRESEDNPPE